MQHEIRRRQALLDRRGDLADPGYAKSLLPVYDRRDIRASRLRIKEWDYYLIVGPKHALALTVADNGYMGLDSVSVLTLGKQPWEKTVSSILPLTLGLRDLPASSATGDISVRHGGWELRFEHTETGRRLFASVKKFGGLGSLRADVRLTEEPAESMVICTPFDKPGRFYFNQKINCMRASGRVVLGGHEFTFRPEDSFAVLDWGRGVWTYDNTWYWGSFSGLDTAGNVFGFNIGCGFGDTSAATENMLFYNGRAHKLGEVYFRIPEAHGRDDFMSPWRFDSDDGRFEMRFVPVLDRAADMNLGVLRSDQHQVFGRFTGQAVLDDGTVVELRDAMGFAEKVHNKW